MGSGVSVGDKGMDVFMDIDPDVKVGGIRVGVGKGRSDGEQADGPARSESSIVIRIIA